MARVGQVRLESFPPRDLQGRSSLKRNGCREVAPDARFRDNIPDPTERSGSWQFPFKGMVFCLLYFMTYG